MANQTYSEKLKDPRWQKKRLEILNRDNWACRSCEETTETLAVHHLLYRRGAEPWEYENDDLVTLCQTCHETERGDRGQAENELLVALRECGFFSMEIYGFAGAIRKTGVNHCSNLLSALIWLMDNKAMLDGLINSFNQGAEGLEK